MCKIKACIEHMCTFGYEIILDYPIKFRDYNKLIFKIDRDCVYYWSNIDKIWKKSLPIDEYYEHVSKVNN